MKKVIDAALDRSRAVMLILLLIWVTGILAYIAIPKERYPDVQIPIIYVSMHHEGISPEDAERLLVRPMEKELRSIEGVKEMTAIAQENYASVSLEFVAGFDSEKALRDVRERVDLAKPELPEETDEPTVNEINLSLFPVINVILTGNIEERTLVSLARDLRDKVEEISSVLEADIAGDREEIVEIIIDPLVIETYGLSTDLLNSVVAGNNQLIAAGSIDTGTGRYNIKVPGLLENLQDIMSLPVKVSGESVLTVGDIAEIRKTYRDPEGFARVNGESAVALEVSKRTGENIINTIKKVRQVVDAEKQYWPEGVQVIYSQDTSNSIIDMLSDLENNLLLATLLVMAVIIAAIGVRSALFIAFAIPTSFLIGILILQLLELTMNIVVLFSLILSVGMLVDTAIVICEYADRKMGLGVSHRKAYGMAAKRFVWPLISATLTTVMVFLPLLWWPGIVGEFMKYMPITLIATLSGSLLTALFFLPVLGTLFDRRKAHAHKEGEGFEVMAGIETHEVSSVTSHYATFLNHALNKPGTFAFSILGILFLSIFLYASFGKGVEFFPDVEPDNAQVQVRARGNLSVWEKDAILKEVEARILDMDDEIRVFYTRTSALGGGPQSVPEDVIGIVQLEFTHWRTRRKASEILEEIRERTQDIAGIFVETQKEEAGPKAGKPIEIEIGSRYPELIAPAIEKVVNVLKREEGITNIEDGRPIPAIEWNFEVNREQAARFNTDVARIGSFVKMVSNGLLATTYRPNDSDDEIDILVRFPEEKRTLDALEGLRIVSLDNNVAISTPMSNFVQRTAQPKVGTLNRTAGQRVMTIKADVEEGVLVDEKIKKLESWLAESKPDPRLTVTFKGEDEDQKEAGDFLTKAFILALFGMALVLVIQFNNIFHMFIILSAVFLSTVGVLLGLLITGRPFGIVMCGVGIITLAGVVVNNNIILIDTYKRWTNEGLSAKEAIIRACMQRLRPILLTAGTTVLGLIPMVIGLNIDFIARDLTFGAPSTQWWKQLATTIAGGLTFATILTLFFTPALLMLAAKWWKEDEHNPKLQKASIKVQQ